MYIRVIYKNARRLMKEVKEILSLKKTQTASMKYLVQCQY